MVTVYNHSISTHKFLYLKIKTHLIVINSNDTGEITIVKPSVNLVKTRHKRGTMRREIFSRMRPFWIIRATGDNPSPGAHPYGRIQRGVGRVRVCGALLPGQTTPRVRIRTGTRLFSFAFTL